MTATADDSAKDVDLAYVPPATAAVVAYPRKALTSPAVEMMPIEVLSAAGKKGFGVDPLDIESMLLVVGPPGEVEPGFGVVLRLAGVYSLDDLKGPLVADTGLAEWNGKPYRKRLYPGAASLLMPDDRTLLIGQEHVLRLMLADDARATEGPLRKLMGRTHVDEDGQRAAHQHRLNRGDEGAGGNEDLVARTYADRVQGRVQRLGGF